MAIYNDPVGGNESTIGTQIRTDFYQKKALIEAKKEQFFSQLADVTSMPKNMGKKIKRYHYLPLLDDANINDQGIDAAGNGTENVSVTFMFTAPDANDSNNGHVRFYLVGEGDDPTPATAAAAAIAAAKAAAESFFVKMTGDAGIWNTDYATTVGDLQTAGWLVTDDTESDHGEGVQDASAAVSAVGNLYGSSKDVGTIAAKLPALSETGGRVNRVGFKRIELEGTIDKFGFFDEYTQESMDFDSDADLEMHITREAVMGANEMTEDALQIDLLNGAGVVRYTGAATGTSELQGDGTPDVLTYGDLMRLSIDLDNNRCPKNTKIITGTRMIDTKTIDAARYLYCGSEMLPTLKAMQDLHSNQAFIQVHQYAAGTNVAVGEVGSIDQFRIIVVPEMMHWAGAGAAVSANSGYRESGGNYDVFPMLVVGSGSFTTIGFQTDGKTVKFKITHKKPGPETADSYNDPYGEMGFYSIKWYYGTMILRPERLAVIKTIAEW